MPAERAELRTEQFRSGWATEEGKEGEWWGLVAAVAGARLPAAGLKVARQAPLTKQLLFRLPELPGVGSSKLFLRIRLVFQSYRKKSLP